MNINHKEIAITREQMISKIALTSKTGRLDYLVYNDRITSLRKLSDQELKEKLLKP